MSAAHDNLHVCYPSSYLVCAFSCVQGQIAVGARDVAVLDPNGLRAILQAALTSRTAATPAMPDSTDADLSCVLQKLVGLGAGAGSSSSAATSVTAPAAVPPSSSSLLSLAHVLLNIEPATPSAGYPTRDVCMPGGHRDADDPNWRTTAVREMVEEMGVHVSPELLRCCVCGSADCEDHFLLWPETGRLVCIFFAHASDATLAAATPHAHRSHRGGEWRKA
jgi:ADP-ribose pyrophosphatase YjhB (NUDIX family)